MEVIDFIANRWEEAKADLSQHDPAYVATMGIYFDMKERLILPDSPPQPSYRLKTEWYDLLQSTMDVAQQLDRLEFTVQKIDTATNRKEADYYFETWVQDIYNLCEKIKVLISLSCGLYSLGRLKDKYREEVEKKVQHNTGRKRQALVHGADEREKGGLGISAGGITEDKLWESLVAVGPGTIPYALDSSHLKPPEWLHRNRPVTIEILGTLGTILSSLDQIITGLPDGS